MSKLNIIQTPSPNFDRRPQGRQPDMLVLHYTGMKTGAEAVARLQDPKAKVSAHYVVDEDGSVLQLVAEEDRAWHAGVSHWAGEDRVNDFSIGVEIVNPGHQWGYKTFPEEQMQAVRQLCEDIVARYDIHKRRVLGHSDVAFSRKEDPGELFNWHMLAEHGVGMVVPEGAALGGGYSDVSPSSPSDEITKLQNKLQQFGYGLKVTGQYDFETILCVKAFQRHWHQSCVTGNGDKDTLEILDILLRK